MNRINQLSRRALWRGVVIIGSVLLLGAGVVGVSSAATTGHNGTSITRVGVLTQDTAAVFTSTTFTTVESYSIFAAAGQNIIARYTAESACAGPSSGWCTIRILIDGLEAEPAVGIDYAYDGAGASNSWEAHSVERVRAVTATGTHTAVVQVAVVNGATSDRLDDSTLVLEAVAQ